jgi:hypothetical protein
MSERTLVSESRGIEWSYGRLIEKNGRYEKHR